MEEEKALVRKVVEQSGNVPSPKRHRLDEEALNARTREELLAILVVLFREHDIVLIQFTVVWHLIQLFPELLRFVWSDEWFRRRVQREESVRRTARGVALPSTNARECGSRGGFPHPRGWRRRNRFRGAGSGARFRGVPSGASTIPRGASGRRGVRS